MGEKRKIQKKGASLVVTIPKEIVDKLGIEKGNWTDVTESGGKIIVEVEG